MAAGIAGRRAGTEVNALPEVSGVVMEGPYWRLPSGTYVAHLRTRPLVGEDGHSSREGEPVVVVDVVARDAGLAEQLLSVARLNGNRMAVTFNVLPSDASPDTRIGLRLRTETAVGFAVEELSVQPAPS